eukprot:10330148-Alexandrium_andersonii.AAC.1
MTWPRRNDRKGQLPTWAPTTTRGTPPRGAGRCSRPWRRPCAFPPSRAATPAQVVHQRTGAAPRTCRA